MNILFDFITLQDTNVNGGNIYTKEILLNLLGLKQNIFGMYDSKKKFSVEINQIIRDNDIKMFDISKLDYVNEFIKKENIEFFFIGVAQRYNKYDLTGINCKIKIVCHDITDLCVLYGDKINNKSIQRFYAKVTPSIKRKLINLLFCGIVKKIYDRLVCRSYSNFFKLVNKSNVTLYTVSEYSAFCIKYYFNIKRNIKVFFPPLRQASIKEELQSDCENIIKGKNFFLLINADKKNKNIKLFLDQWNRFCEETNYDYYAVVIGKINVKLPNIICFNCVTTNDLTYLYRKAFAFIYPSICEGFGYPPDSVK